MISGQKKGAGLVAKFEIMCIVTSISLKILGQKPYQAYAQLTTDEFADRFSNYIRAGSRHLVQYKINLAFLVRNKYLIKS